MYVTANKSYTLLKRKHYLWIWLVWTVVGLLGTTRSAIYGSFRGENSDWFDISFYYLSAAWMWALLMPLLVVVALKIKIHKKNLLKAVPIHLGLGILIASAHRFIAIWADFSVRKLFGILEPSVGQVLSDIKLVIVSSTIDSFFTYWIILALIFGYDYYNKYQENKLKSLKLESELTKSQLNSLKSQLKPHFLFNSMQAIATLMHRDVDLADKVMNDLSELLRESFDNIHTQKVSLDRELKFINKYIRLQQTRFSDRFQVDWDIEDKTRSLLVPNLILQPLVENAIKHGIEPYTQNGKLYIRAFRANGTLNISVVDNGQNSTVPKQFGVGLSNTKQRLEQLYGEDHEMKIQASSGFKINIVIPAEEQKND